MRAGAHILLLVILGQLVFRYLEEGNQALSDHNSVRPRPGWRVWLGYILLWRTCVGSRALGSMQGESWPAQYVKYQSC